MKSRAKMMHYNQTAQILSLRVYLSIDQQWDLSVQNADYESSASYACQKSWTISSTLTKQ